MNQIKNKITAEKFMKGSISKKRGRGPGFAFEGKMKNDGTTLVSTGHNVGLGYQQAGDVLKFPSTFFSNTASIELPRVWSTNRSSNLTYQTKNFIIFFSKNYPEIL